MDDRIADGRADPPGPARLVVHPPRHPPRPRRPRRALLVTAIAAAGLALVAGCGAGSPPAAAAPSTTASASATPTATSAPAPTSSTPSTSSTVTIANFLFAPEALTVPAGAAVRVVNQDGANHTVTAVDGSFDTGNIAGHATGTFTAPSRPGSYPYKCAIHPFMTGTVTVTG